MSIKTEFVQLRITERSLFDRIFKKMRWPEFWFVNHYHGIKFRSSKTEGYVLCFAEYLNNEADLPSCYWLLDYNGREVIWQTVLFSRNGSIMTVLDSGSVPYDKIRNKKTGQVLGGYDVIREARSGRLAHD